MSTVILYVLTIKLWLAALLALMLIIDSWGSFHAVAPNWKIFQQWIQKTWRNFCRCAPGRGTNQRCCREGWYRKRWYRKSGIFPVVSVVVFWSFCIEFLSLFVFSDSAKYQTCLEGLKEDCEGSSPGWLLLVCCGLLKVGKRRVSSGVDVVSGGGWKTWGGGTAIRYRDSRTGRTRRWEKWSFNSAGGERSTQFDKG